MDLPDFGPGGRGEAPERGAPPGRMKTEKPETYKCFNCGRFVTARTANPARYAGSRRFYGSVDFVNGSGRRNPPAKNHLSTFDRVDTSPGIV